DSGCGIRIPFVLVELSCDNGRAETLARRDSGDSKRRPLQILVEVGYGDQVARHEAQGLDARLELNERIPRDRAIQTEEKHAACLIERRDSYRVPGGCDLLAA